MRAIRPGSLAEAVAILAEQPDLVPVAGCTDLMVANPVHGSRLPGVLDVTSIDGLRGVDWQGDILEIGSATTFSDIATSTTIECDFPALVAAARRIGDVGVVVAEIDELHLDYPCAGSRLLRDLLRLRGVFVSRKHVATRMRRARKRGNARLHTVL